MKFITLELLPTLLFLSVIILMHEIRYDAANAGCSAFVLLAYSSPPGFKKTYAINPIDLTLFETSTISSKRLN